MTPPTATAQPRGHGPAWREVAVIAVITVLAFVAATVLDAFEWFAEWSARHERLDLDEVMVALLFASVAVSIYSWRHLREVHEAQASLAESTERYRSLFRLNPLAVVSLDTAGRFVQSNDAAKELMGLRPGQLRGAHYSVLVEPQDRDEMTRRFERMMAGDPQRFELSARRTDGQLVELRITGVPIVVSGRVVGAYDLIEDVTEANRVRGELQRATEAKSLFLANMSHEIRTPLTAMIAAAELLEETELAKVQQELVDRMSRSGARLRLLIDSILDFSAIEAGVTRLGRTCFDPRELLSDAATEARRAARHKRLDFELDLDPSLPTQMTGDPDRILQVVMNLLENAVKFTDSGSVVLAASGGIGSVRFAVTDTGIGLSAEDRATVFESFHQVDPTLTRRYGGSGLGLAICKHLVEMMGGQIRVESEPGRGSTFSFTIPV